MEQPTEGKGRGRGVIAAAAVAGVTFFLLLAWPYLPILDPTGVLRTVIFSVFVLSVSWAVIGFLGHALEFLWPKDRSIARARSAWKVLSYITWFAILVILVFGVMGNVASTALGIGLVGAALTYTMQKPLLNLAAWIVITYRQLYRIGDRVEVGGVKGYVVDVGLQTTELQEFGGWMPGDEYTGRLVAVPNGVVFDGATHNYTRDFPFVWDQVEVLATYESDIDVAKEIMVSSANEVVGGIMFDNFDKYRSRLAIRDLEESLLRTPEVRMHMAASGVTLYVVYFCPADQRESIKSRIVEKLWRRFSADPRVEIAYPHVQMVRPLEPEAQATASPKAEWLVPPPHQGGR